MVLMYHITLISFKSMKCLAYYWIIAIFKPDILNYRSWTFNDANDALGYENSMDVILCYSMQCRSNLKHRKIAKEFINLCDEFKTIRQRENALGGIKIYKQWFKSPAYKIQGLDERILIMGDEFRWNRLQVGGTVNQGLDRFYGGLNRPDYVTFVKNYLLRMQPIMKHRVYEIVKRSYGDYNGNYSHSVSIMIRWGDKCYNAGKFGQYPHPEMYCFTYHEYMGIIRLLKEIEPDLKYVIVTSESREIVENITMQYKEWMGKNGMRFIINVVI